MNPFDPGYFTENELRDAGFKALGHHVRIARNATLIGLEHMEIGDHVRIDGYCTLIAAGSGGIRLGSYIHIGAYSLLSAGDGIQMDDFSGLSQGVRIYSRSDDYSGEWMTNPTVPEAYTGVKRGAVRLERHVIIGSGTVILPDLVIGEGAAVGALTLVNRSLEPWGIYSGVPARKNKERSRRLLELEEKLRQERS